MDKIIYTYIGEQLCLVCEAAKCTKKNNQRGLTMNFIKGEINCAYAIICMMIVMPITDAELNLKTEATITITEPKGKLLIAIHYGALCPYSKYIIRQMVHKELQDNNWWPLTELKVYPFGKAFFYNNSTGGEMQLLCEHGPEECELNALHACIIETLDIRSAFDLINCMLSSEVDKCAQRLHLNVNSAKECKRTRKTTDILEPYGKETLALDISNMPSIIFENQLQSYDQSNKLYSFRIHFCIEYMKKFYIQLPTCA